MTNKKDNNVNQLGSLEYLADVFPEAADELNQAYDVICEALTKLIVETEINNQVILFACVYNAMDMAVALLTKMNDMQKDEIREEIQFLLTSGEIRAEESIEGRQGMVYTHIYERIRKLIDVKDGSESTDGGLH